MPDENKHVFRVRIRAPIEAVWDEITRTNVVKPAMFQTKLLGDLRVGGKMEYVSESTGSPEITGEILEIDPPRRLVHTFRFSELADEPTRVSFELREIGEEVEVTLTHDAFVGETATLQRVVEGWPVILDQLKKIVEGRPPLAVSKCPSKR